jgi:hypothetical protein
MSYSYVPEDTDVGYYTLRTGKWLLMFEMSILPPSSRCSKSK